MKKIICMILAAMLLLCLAACGGETTQAGTKYPDIPGLEDGILTVGMECVYAPYNWTQLDNSNGGVEIVNNPGKYANGYDVMIAKKFCEKYGLKLEVMAVEWNGLTPALNAGTIDMVIAGQSMTPERKAEVDMAGPYFLASIVCVARKDTPQAAATGLSQLTGTCTAQTGTIWYESCLPQVKGATLMPAAEDAPAMIMAATSGTVDFICTDMPTAMAACATYDNLVIVNLSEADNFVVDQSEIDIGVSVKKGNSGLKEMMDTVLSTMTVEDFNKLMDEAIKIQPKI